ncbi:hypothetical protein QLX08_001107 [Tetragonisca angustula]|uniref:Uncharacterized protein n=1 Tax=Tetragonisca angustula TaxID=166442 RepID=A0AAW1AGJ4_9HYME
MELIGIWPEPCTTGERLSKVKTLLYLSIVFLFGVGPQSVNLFFIWGDLELVTENLSMANIPYITAMIKSIFIWYYKESFKSIMKSFYDDWHSVKTEEEKATMLKMAKLAKFISILCSSSSLVMITAFLSFRVVTVYLADKVNENQDRLSLYPGYFPFDVRPAPILITINFAQVIAAYSATICYTTVDAFIAMLITHMCGQFAILKKKLLRLMSDDRECRSVDEFQRELTLIVTKHDHLNG